jgi:hypothetical protein
MLNPNQAFLLVEKLKFALRGFTLGVEAEIENIIFNLPQLLVNAELSGLVLVLRVKNGYHRFWEANLQPLGSMFQHLLIF